MRVCVCVRARVCVRCRYVCLQARVHDIMKTRTSAPCYIGMIRLLIACLLATHPNASRFRARDQLGRVGEAPRPRRRASTELSHRSPRWSVTKWKMISPSSRRNLQASCALRQQHDQALLTREIVLKRRQRAHRGRRAKISTGSARWAAVSAKSSQTSVHMARKLTRGMGQTRPNQVKRQIVSVSALWSMGVM